MHCLKWDTYDLEHVDCCLRNGGLIICLGALATYIPPSHYSPGGVQPKGSLREYMVPGSSAIRRPRTLTVKQGKADHKASSRIIVTWPKRLT
jgi:hypothetical protein